MPQMAPLYWIFISPFTLLSFFLILCFLFFNKKYFIFSSSSISSKNNIKPFYKW